MGRQILTPILVRSISLTNNFVSLIVEDLKPRALLTLSGELSINLAFIVSLIILQHLLVKDLCKSLKYAIVEQRKAHWEIIRYRNT